MKNEEIAARIDAMESLLADTLSAWLRVPSVKADPEPGAPFGPEVRRMLDLALETGRSLGFSVRDVDGYACDMTLGSAPESIAVLAHLDVVPAGDGWTRPPFEATREGDRIYARGTSDDKGPAVAALIAMKAIRDAGIPLKRSIRLILGCDEESGWEDMAYYAAHIGLPELGFSPDASFPLINTEKGMLHCMIHAPLAEDGLQVKRLWTGERMNVIPGECEALLEGGADLAAQTAAYAGKTGLPYEAELTAEGVRVIAHGIPGHSAYPWDRRNAIGMMLCLLKELGVQGPLLTLANALGMEHTGASLGCACRDEVSGELTCNMGILHLENGQISASLDLRCPITADLKALEASLRSHLPGFTFGEVETKAPHHVPADSELVSCLLAAFTEETGLPGVPEATGGGTYAKVLKQGVAFGASFPGDEDLAHQANEYTTVSGLIKSAKIYANALLRLCAE